jgi:hypothetical protein
MNINMNNIFGLPDPDNWSCETQNLTKGHGLLTIRLSNQNVESHIKELHFQHVSYYSGWTAWKGANFRIAPQAEYLNFVRGSLPKFAAMSDEDLMKQGNMQYNRLFICETSEKGLIYVLADAGWTLDKDGKTLVEQPD